jgi:hypothetical protein
MNLTSLLEDCWLEDIHMGMAALVRPHGLFILRD